ncbi:PREDICTED: uncharacterized protein LOC109463456 [Branchiostoma belcheri]|uniref:Uncharacterized protein LOC109463456 n=1 Tax=Branchiostoma belcheri TaxID=7741 RepID=A0A6P4XUT9_BRABE|nr:PREDICTED: uncharacterized protein LOC109463456 [Branchiostoma belcheri]
MGILKKLVILYLLSCLVDDKHEKLRTLIAHMPLKDAVGLRLVEKLPVFETTKDSLRVYQITDSKTFISAYVQPSDTGGLGRLVRCYLYKDRSRDVMMTTLTDYGWKDHDAVMNVVTDANDVWRYSYLLDSCFWLREGRHFDELAELPPPDPLTWLLQAGRNIYKTTFSYFKDAGKTSDLRMDDRTQPTTPKSGFMEYLTTTFWPEDVKPDTDHDSAKDEDAADGWFTKLCRSVRDSVPTAWPSGDVTSTVQTGQTGGRNRDSPEIASEGDEFSTGLWHGLQLNYLMDYITTAWTAKGGGGEVI